jgi:SAM-dependent methyltransferase
MVEENSARVAYDRFAPFYDEFNKQNNYEVWLGEVLLPELEKHGLQKNWALDVGCGTGRAFEPLLKRGWQVWGIEPSNGMREIARAKYPRHGGSGIHLAEWDARKLPVWRMEGFDLILALNDVVNYLTEDGDLKRCFEGMKRNLAPGGLVCFDVNSIGLMRNNFAGEGMTRGEWTWRGLAERVELGGTYEATVSAPGMEESVHRQRHWMHSEIRDALHTSGLTCLSRLGQREEGGNILLNDPADEEQDAKVLYIGGHANG